MENLYIDEEKLVKHITPKIEYRIVQSIINTLEEQFYPPEEMIREEFIKAVKETWEKAGKDL